MRKSFLLAAAVISLAACTNQTDVLFEPAPQELTIKPVTHKSSRAALIGSILPADMEVYVFATRANASSYENWIENGKFTCAVNEQGNWAGGYLYDPGFTDFELMAYTSDTGSDQVKPASTTFTTDDVNRKITSLALAFTGDGNKLAGNTDVMVTKLVKGTKSSSAFPMEFHHALSWVFVNFVAPETNEDFRIKNVKINNVYLTGTLTVTPSYPVVAPTADPYIIECTENWTPAGAAAPYYFPAYSEYPAGQDYLTLGQASAKLAQGLMILPCTKTSITFEYCIKAGAEYTSWHTYNIDLSEGGAHWDAGKKYEYRISIGSNAIEVNPSVSDWETIKQPDQSL